MAATNTGVLDGTKMGIYIAGTLIAHALSSSISKQKGTRETTNKDTTGDKTFKYTRGSNTISGEAHFAFDAGYGFDDLFAAMDAETELTVLMSTDDTGDSTYGGTALLTQLDANFPDADNSSYNFSMQVSGDLEKGAVAGT